jgi:hypothetical protein
MVQHQVRLRRLYELASYLSGWISVGVDIHVIHSGHEIGDLRVAQHSRPLKRADNWGSLSIALRSALALAALANIFRNPKHETRVLAGWRWTVEVGGGGGTTQAGIAALPR